MTTTEPFLALDLLHAIALILLPISKRAVANLSLTSRDAYDLIHPLIFRTLRISELIGRVELGPWITARKGDLGSVRTLLIDWPIEASIVSCLVEGCTYLKELSIEPLLPNQPNPNPTEGFELLPSRIGELSRPVNLLRALKKLTLGLAYWVPGTFQIPKTEKLRILLPRWMGSDSTAADRVAELLRSNLERIGELELDGLTHGLINSCPGLAGKLKRLEISDRGSIPELSQLASPDIALEVLELHRIGPSLLPGNLQIDTLIVHGCRTSDLFPLPKCRRLILRSHLPAIPPLDGEWLTKQLSGALPKVEMEGAAWGWKLDGRWRGSVDREWAVWNRLGKGCLVGVGGSICRRNQPDSM